MNTVMVENLRLVQRLVNKLARRLDGGRAVTSMDQEDLEQAGCIGLMRAFPKWKPELGAFSTYLAHWVRLELQKAFAASLPIKKPKAAERPWSVTKEQDKFKARTGREPTAQELDTIVKDLRDPNAKPIPINEKLMDEWRIRASTLSLDDSAMKRGMVSVQKMGNGGTGNNTGLLLSDESTRHDITPDTRPNPEQMVSQAETVTRLARGMHLLPELEQQVIMRLFFGSQGVPTVAKGLGLTKTEIVNLRDSALKTLKRLASE